MEGTAERKIEMGDESGISRRYVFAHAIMDEFANGKILEDYLQVKTRQHTLSTIDSIPKTTGRRYVASKP